MNFKQYIAESVEHQNVYCVIYYQPGVKNGKIIYNEVCTGEDFASALNKIVDNTFPDKRADAFMTIMDELNWTEDNTLYTWAGDYEEDVCFAIQSTHPCYNNIFHIVRTNEFFNYIKNIDKLYKATYSKFIDPAELNKVIKSIKKNIDVKKHATTSIDPLFNKEFFDGLDF